MGMVPQARVLPWVLVALAASLGAQQRTPVDGSGRGEDEEKRAEEIELLFVDPSGKPLPRAEVRLAVEDEHDGSVLDASIEGGMREGLRLHSPPRASDVDGLLARRPVVRPSATGVVKTPWPRERGLLVAGRVPAQEGRAELWGFRWFPRDWRETAGRAHPSGKPLVVKLTPDWDLHVRILDGDRAVRDLGVRAACGPWRRGLGNARSDDYHLEHVGFDLFRASEPLVVGLTTLLSPPVEVRLNPHRAPSGPVVLRLPPVGAVEVRVLDAFEQPLVSQTFVELSFAPVTEPAGRRFDPDGPPGVSAGTRAGKARFDGVSLGRELEVRVSGDPPIVKTFRGPSTAGEVVSVTLVRPATVPEVPEALATAPSPAPAEPEPIGTVEGFVLLDPGIPPSGVELNLRSKTPAGDRLCGASFASDGKFSFGSVEPGPARLEIWPSGMRIRSYLEDVSVFALDFTVVPGEVQDARLAAIDLRGKLFAHAIRLKGVDRERPFHARVFFGQARSPKTPRAYEHFWQLPLVLVSPWKTIDLDLFAPGYRMVSRLGVGASVDVELEPGIPVRLRLVTDGLLPEPPLYLKALLVPSGPNAGSSQWGLDWEGPAFGPTRELVTTAWVPGRTKVRWIYSRELQGHRSSGAVRPDVSPEQYIEVKDSPHEQVFEVEIPAEELARLMRRAEE